MATSYKKFTKNIRTTWVADFAEKFLIAYSKLNDVDIEQFAKDKLEEFSQICQERAEKRAKDRGMKYDPESWKSSAASYLSPIRKAFVEAFGEKPEVLKNFVFSKEFYEKKRERYEGKKQAQRRNLTPIKDVEAIQKIIEEDLQSNDWRAIAAAIILSTSPRQGEVLKTAEMKQVSQFQVQFEGQIKTKGKDRDAYTKYTIVESWLVVDGLLKLRRMADNKSLKREELANLDSRANTNLNNYIKKRYSDVLEPALGKDELTSHSLRSAYCAIAFYLFGDWSQTLGSFIKDNLGHVGDAEAANYEDYQVTDLNGKPLVQGAWVNRMNEQIIEPTQTIVNPRLRMTKADREVLDDQELLPFPDLPSRMEELVRLAKIGKQFEEGNLVKEVVKVVEKPVEKIVTVPSQVEDIPKPSPRKSIEEMSNEELFGANIPNSGAEKIRRAVAAVKTYNERQAERKYWWAINSKVIKDLTNCRTEAVSRFLESEEGRLQVKDYNEMHQLGYHHNRGKGSIKEVVKLV